MTDTMEIDLDELSFDARILAAAWFGMGMKTSVTLHLRESRPAPRTRAAMDELVAKKVISVEPYNEFGGLVCRPLMDCRNASRWLHGALDDEKTAALAKWSISEPIDEDQAYELMTPYGQGVWDKERRGKTLRENRYDAAVSPTEHERWRKGHRAGARA